MNYKTKAKEKIVQSLIDSLSQNEIPWEKPWTNGFYNPVTGKYYTGNFNLMVLNYYAEQNGYKDPRWVTYQQAKGKEWQVKEGEHGTTIEFWSAYDSQAKKKLSLQEANKLLKEDIKAKDYIRFISKSYTVFNAEQIDNIPKLPEKPLMEKTNIFKQVEQIGIGMGVTKKEGTAAYYSPIEDQIVMPPFQGFKNEQAYCATLLHELAHATGHVSRLNRDINNIFGSSKYAKEELRAEIASAFMMGMLEVNYDDSHIENHRAYVSSWIEILKNDPDQLFKAIKDAEKIQNYMTTFCPELEREIFIKEATISEKECFIKKGIQKRREEAIVKLQAKPIQKTKPKKDIKR